MSEYFSQIGLFWHFIEKLDECTRDAIDIEHIADDAARSSIEKELILFSLYNREFSARLEFYSNLEKDDRSRLKEKCGNFYVINSDVSCTLDSTLFNSPARPRFDFDHILFENNENSLIAYVDIADPEFSKFNKQLEKFCNENKAALILRHRDLRADTKDYLGGYGAELLVKNMEYKPIEDANSIQNSNEKDWNIEDLPFKALESVLNILPDWNKMTHILETLPLHLSEFSAVEYSSKTKEEAMMSAFQNSQLVGENIFLVNGHYLQPDFWTLLGTLRAEIDALENLKLLGIPHDAALSILEKSNLNLHAYKGEGGAFLKTGPSTGRIYINDLENDTKYARWTKNYQVFLMSYGRDLEQVARHFFNLILVADLREESGWHAIELVRQMYEFDWPVRLGLILLGNDPIANILTQAIKSLKNKEDELNSFLKDIDINLSYNQILKLFNQYCFDCDFDEEIGHTVTRSNNFCEESGICGPVKFILNGRVLDINVDVNDLEEFQNNLTVEIMKEKRQIMMFAMYGSLQPPLDTFFENVKYAKPVERINLEITQPSSDQIEVDDRSHDGFLVELNDLAKLVSFTVIANDDSDKKLVSDSFEMLRRFSHLALRVRYILNLNSIDEDWDKIMCFIMAINDRKKGNFDEFVCDYNTNDYRRLIIKPNTDLKSGVIVNGRYLKRHFIKSFRDLMIAHDVETQRLRVNEIFEELTKHISSNEISNIIEKSTQVILKHVKHLPYFAQYSSDPIPQTIRRKSVSRVIQSDSIRYFNVDLLLNPLSEKGQVLASLGK